MPNANGPALLRRYIEEHGLNATTFGRAASVKHSTVLGWCSGRFEPDHENRIVIHKLTCGAVPYLSWRSSRALVDRVRRTVPFG